METLVAEAITHDSGCPVLVHSDEARRCSDAVNLHVSALGWEATGKWVAIRLSDGGSDGTLYDLKRDAVKGQFHEQLCCYVSIPPSGMNACSAESYLALHRKMYDAGIRLVDPDAAKGGGDVLRRITRRDRSAQLARLR
jgi:hypothetical protein